MHDASVAPSEEPIQLAPSRIPPDALDEQGRIAIGLPCRQCDYNLQTLEFRGNCPECGTAVQWSLFSDLLRFADADWLSKLSRGMSWVLMSILVGFVTTFTLVVVTVLIQPFDIAPIGNLACGLLVEFAIGFGLWQLTAAEPQLNSAVASPAGTRGWARWLLTASIGIGVASYLLGFFGLAFGYTPAINQAIEILDLISWTVFTAGGFCLAVVLRRLALRAPRDDTAKGTLQVIWGWAVCISLLIVVKSFAATYELIISNPSASNPSAVQISIDVLSGTLGLVGLVLIIWTLVLMISYHRLFKHQARIARLRHVWAHHTLGGHKKVNPPNATPSNF